MRTRSLRARDLSSSRPGPLARRRAGRGDGRRRGAFSIVGATIHPVSGPDIAGGTIVVRDGKIASVSPGAAPEPGAPVVDGKGKHVYPSLFPPMTVARARGDRRRPRDARHEELGGINPAARADVAINYDSELLPVARSGAFSSPASRRPAASSPGRPWRRSSTAGRARTRRSKAPAAITVYWPDLRINRSPDAQPYGQEAGEAPRRSPREAQEGVPRRARLRQGARPPSGRPGVPRHDFDPAPGGAPARHRRDDPRRRHAQRLAQIRDAMKWAAEEKLRLVIWGGADAWRMADELAKAGVPVILESPLELPVREDDPYDAQFADAGVLDRAGVRVAFNDGGDDASNVRNFPQLAAMAVAFGYPAREGARGADARAGADPRRRRPDRLPRARQGRDPHPHRRRHPRSALPRGRRVPRRARARPHRQAEAALRTVPEPAEAGRHAVGGERSRNTMRRLLSIGIALLSCAAGLSARVGAASSRPTRRSSRGRAGCSRPLRSSTPTTIFRRCCSRSTRATSRGWTSGAFRQRSAPTCLG